MKNLKLFFVVLAAGCLWTPAQAQTSSNTLVRFRVSTGGKALGEMVVELFDQQKPITVSNFLNYVRSGRYTTNNTILHRTEPGFILQGGVLGVCNPYITVVYSDALIVPEDPPIINETQSGPLIGNTFGTIAMATEEGDPHSATASWFFNLANNPSLNTNNGGYCVFGRVKTGSEFLKRFNTTYVNRVFHVVNNGTNHLQLFSLPVPYSGTYSPYNSELFVVDISIVSSDSLRPTVAITSPTTDSTPPVSDSSITVSGTSSDKGGIGMVQTYFNLDCAVTATGTTNWTALLTGLVPGTNLVVAQSTDRAGNRSAPAYRSIFRKVPQPFTLNIEGAGNVTGATNGEMLDINRRYVLTAVPAPGNLFAGWTGGVQQASSVLGFYMETNFTLTAKFVTNAFPRVKGTYVGLFQETNNVRPNSSGLITFTTTDSIGFSGKATLDGRSYSFSGSFTPYGQGYAFIDRRPLDNYPPFLAFSVNLDNPDGQIVGEMRGNNWIAGVQAYRVGQNSTTSPSPFAAKHTLVLPGWPDPDTGAGGDSFGTASVDALGNLTFSGTLADGSRITQRSPLGSNGKWPFHVPLNSGKGALFGWVTLDPTQPLTDLSGPVTWSRPPSATTKYNRAGFTNTTQLIGSRFVAPATGGSVTRIMNGQAAFTGGNLAAPFVNNVSFGPGDKLTNNSPNKLTLTLMKPTGLFSGTVTPPGTARSLPFKGAFLQKPNIGSGYFLDTNRIGKILLSPTAP